MTDGDKRCLVRIVLCAACACHPLQNAQAGGFYIRVKGATGTGLATAGNAARAEDASVAYFNPAGIALLDKPMAQAGVDLIFIDVKIANLGSTAATPGTLGAALGYAGRDGDGGKPTPVPNFYYTRPLSNDLSFGFAVTTPFGLGVEYAPDWFGRYDSIKSKLVTLDIAPSLAWRLNPSWSIGGGINVQYADATLTNAIPNSLNPGGPTAATDGFAKLTGDSWAAGFNVGALYRASENTRVGLHYRSKIKHRIEGDATISGLSGPLAAANGTFATMTDLKLPPIVSLGVAHDVAPAWTLLAEAQWFGWSKFEEIRVRFANGLPDNVRPQRFRDSYSLAFGAEFKATREWTLRGGVLIDKTPTVDGFRNSSIPDTDVTLIGLGATYRASQRVQFDLGYLNAQYKHGGINLNSGFFTGTPVAGVVTLRGRIDNKVHVISVGLRYQF